MLDCVPGPAWTFERFVECQPPEGVTMFGSSCRVLGLIFQRPCWVVGEWNHFGYGWWVELILGDDNGI